MAGRMRAIGAAMGCMVALSLLACVPIFTDGLFQTLSLAFRFDNAIPAGEATVVHRAVFPESVKVKKNFVQIAGKLTSDDGLPGSVRLEAELADLDSGRVSQRISVKLNVGADGTFKGSARIKKNVNADEMMTVTLEPAGGEIAKGTAITLCVDLVKKKGDLKRVPECVSGGGNGDGGGGGGETLSALQADFLTPSCALAGCHSQGSRSAGLALEAGSSFANLVNVPSSEVPNLNRVTPNDPENSYLIKKLRGDPDIDGAQMPLGDAPLTNAQIQRFVDWINDGARNN